MKRRSHVLGRSYWSQGTCFKTPVTDLELFAFEMQIDRIAALENPTEQDDRQLEFIIKVLENSLQRTLYSNGN